MKILSSLTHSQTCIEFCWTQKKMLWRIVVIIQLTVSTDFHIIFLPYIEVNGYVKLFDYQHIFFCVQHNKQKQTNKKKKHAKRVSVEKWKSRIQVIFSLSLWNCSFTKHELHLRITVKCCKSKYFIHAWNLMYTYPAHANLLGSHYLHTTQNILYWVHTRKYRCFVLKWPFTYRVNSPVTSTHEGNRLHLHYWKHETGKVHSMVFVWVILLLMDMRGLSYNLNKPILTANLFKLF